MPYEDVAYGSNIWVSPLQVAILVLEFILCIIVYLYGDHCSELNNFYGEIKSWGFCYKPIKIKPWALTIGNLFLYVNY